MDCVGDVHGPGAIRVRRRDASRLPGDMLGKTSRVIESALEAFGSVVPRDPARTDPHRDRGKGFRPDGSVPLAEYVRRRDRDRIKGPVISSVVPSAEEFQAFAPRKPLEGETWTVPEAIAKKLCREASPMCYQHAPRPHWVRSVVVRAEVQTVRDGVAEREDVSWRSRALARDRKATAKENPLDRPLPFPGQSRRVTEKRFREGRRMGGRHLLLSLAAAMAATSATALVARRGQGSPSKRRSRTRRVNHLRLPILILGASLLPAQDPPPPCGGTEDYQIIVQASPDGGSSWYTGSLSLYGYPGQVVNLPVRTVLKVGSGETQGWSFSLEHDDSGLQAAGGYLTLGTVTTTGTHTATVQHGTSAPDFNATEVQGASTGFTQGVVIDNDTGSTLSSPTGTFVNAGACYSLGFLTQETYGYTATLTVTHDLGSPPVRAVLIQNGQSLTPCVQNLTISMAASYSYWASNSCPSDWTYGWEVGGYSAGTLEPAPSDEPEHSSGGASLDGGDPAGIDFRRGDANGDGSLDISDAVFTLTWLFLGTAQPGCLDAADTNDDETIDLSDPISSLSFLFQGGTAPPAPGHTTCGPDLTDALVPMQGCDAYSHCDQTDSDQDGLTDHYESLIGSDSIPVLPTPTTTASSMARRSFRPESMARSTSRAWAPTRSARTSMSRSTASASRRVIPR